jgi:hypothetical protein
MGDSSLCTSFSPASGGPGLWFLGYLFGITCCFNVQFPDDGCCGSYTLNPIFIHLCLGVCDGWASAFALLSVKNSVHSGGFCFSFQCLGCSSWLHCLPDKRCAVILLPLSVTWPFPLAAFEIFSLSLVLDSLVRLAIVPWFIHVGIVERFGSVGL